jgi:hypothetical protein
MAFLRFHIKRRHLMSIKCLLEATHRRVQAPTIIKAIDMPEPS